MPSPSISKLQAITLLTVVIIIIFLPTWSSLFSVWATLDHAYSHGSISTLLAIYALYSRKTEINNTPQTTNYIAIIALFFTSFTWFITQYIQIQIAGQLLLPAIIFFTIAGKFGLNIANQSIIPLMYIMLGIPVWDYLVPFLQAITTFVAGGILNLINIPVFIQGNFISIPFGTFQVAGGCSGVRYLLSAMTLSLFFAQKSPKKTIILTLLTGIFFGLLANWIRVFLIILIGHMTEMTSSLVKDHDTFGWVVFGASLIPAFFVFGIIEKKTKQNSKPIINNETSKNNTPSIQTSHLGLSLLLLSLSIGPALLLIQTNQSINTTQYKFSHTPPNSDWIHIESNNNWSPILKGAYLYQNIAFQNKTDRSQIHINNIFFGTEEQGKELISDDHKLLGNDNWNKKPLASGIQLPNSVKVSPAVVSYNNQTKLVYHYYKVGNTETPNKLLAKLAQIQTLAFPKTPKAFIAFSTNCSSDCIVESKTLATFIDEFKATNTIIPYD
jgi:exosortase A